MKFNYLTKSIPFLTTLLLIIVLSIGNKKETTNLRILIWSTPSLSLSTYLAISTGAGFILSFLVTSNFVKINQSTSQYSLRLKEEVENEESNEYTEQFNNLSYDNTLIERDIKDPSPTVNASFRIIGKERSKTNFTNSNNNEYDDSLEFDQQYQSQPENNEVANKNNLTSSDWNDESYTNW